MPHRIALIHALAESVTPINQAFDSHWPSAVRMNLLDDSLSADLARSPTGLDAAMTQRFVDLAGYALGAGSQAILFTCSAFGPCIDTVKTRWPHIQVLKPNEALIDEITHRGFKQIGLLATFAPTLVSMPPEFPQNLQLVKSLVPDALAALKTGDAATHDRLITHQAVVLANQGVEAIALAQFSMARAAMLIRDQLEIPVLTTPDSAVTKLKLALNGL
jgi:aspartate/glutamate racemase